MITPQNGAAIAGAWQIDHASETVYYLLHGLHHRGSDGAGIASADGENVRCFKRLGMLSESFNSQRFEDLPGRLAIGQVRMASSSDVASENLQPVMVRAHQGSFAVASIGMISNAPSLRRHMEEDGLIFQGTGDAEIIAHLIQVSPGKMAEKIEMACHMLHGAYAFLVMTKNTMYAVRSRQAIHPLYYAKEGEGCLFASETSAFGMFSCSAPQVLAPGQLLILGKNGFSTVQMDVGCRHLCAMDPVYYAREDSLFGSESVHKKRQKLGQALAKGETHRADIVIGVPDTATSGAVAFAQSLNLPYEIGLIKNRYLGSTFVRPAREWREQGMDVRLNAISSIVRDRSIFVVDDSIQKGVTAKRICSMLKAAGAREVHFRVTSPQIMHACLYGTEYIEENELASRMYSDEELCEIIGADSLRFLDKNDFEQALDGQLCMGCMSGRYPYPCEDFDVLHEELRKEM